MVSLDRAPKEPAGTNALLARNAFGGLWRPAHFLACVFLAHVFLAYEFFGVRVFWYVGTPAAVPKCAF